MRALSWILIGAVAACSGAGCGNGGGARSGSAPATPGAAAPAAGESAEIPPAAAGWPATLSISDENGCFTRGGKVLCWGSNEYGVLGPAPMRSRDEAAPIAGIDDAISVAVLSTSICVLRRGGEVVCWGGNEPKHALVSDATAIEASSHHVCALRRNGKVACWGFSPSRAHGQAQESVEEAADVDGVADAQAIATTYEQSCALRRDGSVLCWGAGIDASDKADWVPVPLPGATEIDAVWGGQGTICVRRRAGAVACLGRTDADDDGDRDDGEGLVTIDDWNGARQVSTAVLGACAILADGRLSCFGSSITRSEWWIGPLSEEYPTTLDEAGQATAVAARTRLCILDAGGLPRCRGVADVYRPRPVTGIDDATSLVGGGNGVCARRRSSKTAWCWGAFNALGSKASAPETLENERDIHDAAQLHVDRALCVVDKKAQLHCGDSFDFTGRPRLTRVRQYATIGFHECVVRTDATVWCWGYNSKGELGDGTTTPAGKDAPVQVRGVRDAVEVVAGYQMSCARLRSGAVRCWGTGATDRFIDGEVPGVGDAVELDAATNVVCARRKRGTVTCWGSIYDLVRGRRYDDVGPVDLPDITDAVDVDAGDHDVCVARADGSVVCAGRVTGRLDSDPPLLRIDGFDDAVAVTTGDRFVCALRRGGGVSCMGNNHYGAVGDGSAEEMRPIPLRAE